MHKPSIPILLRRKPNRTFKKSFKHSEKPETSFGQHIWAKAALSWLRHYANVRPDGYTQLSTLNAHGAVPNATTEEILRYVKQDRLRNLQVVLDHDPVVGQVEGQPNLRETWYIRALHGHTIPCVDISTHRFKEPESIPVSLVYATTPEAWKHIESNGIRPEYPTIHTPLHYNPNFIYFARDLTTLCPPPDLNPTPEIQESVQLHITLDAPATMAAGIKIFRTKYNQFISTGLADRSIPPSVFKRAEVVVVTKEMLRVSRARVDRGFEQGTSIENMTSMENPSLARK